MIDQPTAGVALKPCPFCGGTDLGVSTYDVQPDDYHSGYVTCSNCDAEGARPDEWLGSKTEAHNEAIAAWNRRATPASGPVEADDRLAVAVEALKPFSDIAGRYLTGGLRSDLESRAPDLIKLFCAKDFYTARKALALLTKSGEAEG